MTTYKQSALGAELRAIADAHPGVTVHPNSPVGPYVRAVLWTAKVGRRSLRGQALWEPDTGQWTVRAFDEALGMDSVEAIHLPHQDDIPDAITQVLARF